MALVAATTFEFRLGCEISRPGTPTWNCRLSQYAWFWQPGAVAHVEFAFVSQHLSGSADCEFHQPHHVVMVYRHGRVAAKEYDVEGMGGRRVETPRAGSTWVLPAEHRGAALARGNSEAHYCQLTVPTTALGTNPVQPTVGSDPLLYALVQRIHDIGGRTDVAARLLYESLTETVRLHLHDQYTPRAAAQIVDSPKRLDEAAVAALREYLADSLDSAISLQALAQLSGMPVNRFAKAFSDAFHTTPHQYVIAQRISRARALLTTTGLTITEISTSVGFSTPSHFATTFKDRLGVTPTQYRQNMTNVGP